MKATRKSQTTIMAATAVLAILTTACNNAYPGAGADGDSASAQQQFDELMTRPDIDEALRGYRATLADLRQTLTARFDLTGWRSGGGGDVSPGCNDFPDVVTVVKDTAARHGFTDVIFEAGKAEHREIQFKDRYGAQLYVGTGTNTLIGITTGCHLDPDAKRRGTPTATSAP